MIVETFKNLDDIVTAIQLPDILKGIFENPKYKSDGLHPNAEGYRIIAERIFRYLEPLLKESVR